jgi:murein DD-endopeptidase MepM/ murein hydrolase activator NlpD
MTRVFPVPGPANFRDDWGDPRSGGRAHAGTDIFAARGTPVVAVEAGRVVFDVGKLGGLQAILSAGNRTYIYAHLDRWAGSARKVRQGEVIGYVGDSGNAAGGPPHLHFEVREDGVPTNPYPLLMQWRGDLAPAASPRVNFAWLGWGLLIGGGAWLAKRWWS